jgi:hypothetical protein
MAQLRQVWISAWEDCAVACLVSIRDPRAGLVISRQTFARCGHGGAPGKAQDAPGRTRTTRDRCRRPPQGRGAGIGQVTSTIGWG